MESLNVATIQFTDVVSGDAGVAIVRLTDRAVGLCLSLKQDGDVEVFLSNSDASHLVAALNAAIQQSTK